MVNAAPALAAPQGIIEAQQRRGKPLRGTLDQTGVLAKAMAAVARRKRGSARLGAGIADLAAFGQRGKQAFSLGIIGSIKRQRKAVETWLARAVAFGNFVDAVYADRATLFAAVQDAVRRGGSLFGEGGLLRRQA